MALLRIVLALGLTGVALWLWRETYDVHCTALVIPGLVVCVIAYRSSRYTIARRRCLADGFVRPETMLHRMLSRPILPLVVAFVLSVCAGLVLLLNILTWPREVLWALAVDAGLVALAFAFMRRKAAEIFQPEAARLLAVHVLVVVNALGLLLVLVGLQYYLPFADFIDRSLALPDMIERASLAVGSDCVLIHALVRVHVAKEAVGWWLVLNASQHLSDPGFRLGAWILFLVGGSLSTWAWSGLVVQIVDWAFGARRENVPVTSTESNAA